MARLVLKAGRDKSLLRHHPWIFSGAIQHAGENIASGETVDVHSFDGQFLARAAYSPNSQIRARVWTFEDEPVDADFFRNRIRASIQARDVWGLRRDTDSYRLIYAESDGIPGLIVDRYGDVLVLQSLAAGAEVWKEAIADLLLEETGLSTIYERSDADVRELEGLEPKAGLLRDNLPQLSRGIPGGLMTIHEHSLLFNVNFAGGHKTGFYLDQRRNRLRIRQIAKDKDVLDCFCYTGGFTLNALSGGAKSVLSVDSSADALALCQENISLNQLPEDRHTVLEGDVFQLLRKFRDEARSFDMIILDPPKFAPTASQAAKAARGYKDINLFAFKLLRPGGLLVTFSCSGGVDAALFQKIVAGAALDAGADAQIVEHLSQALDHPVALNFPEGFYLKGLICLSK
jgi:23S rRNA (cytosine1962-C5)-methyltransferase